MDIRTALLHADNIIWRSTGTFDKKSIKIKNNILLNPDNTLFTPTLRDLIATDWEISEKWNYDLHINKAPKSIYQAALSSSLSATAIYHENSKNSLYLPTNLSIGTIHISKTSNIPRGSWYPTVNDLTALDWCVNW